MRKVVKDAETAAKTATRKAAKTVSETVSTAAEKAVKKAEEVKAEVVAEVKKPAARKAAPAKKAVKETVYLQYLGKEINADELMKAVKDIWTKQLKNKAADLKSVSLYLKPEENMAYYVINDEVTGNIAL